MYCNKKKGLAIIVLIIILIIYVSYDSLQDYKVYSSFNSTSGNYRETEMKIVVYKAHKIPHLYQDIAEKHNRLNGTPDKLTLKLYFTERAIKQGRIYRTIIFDYIK